jgi:hypothetical protein
MMMDSNGGNLVQLTHFKTPGVCCAPDMEPHVIEVNRMRIVEGVAGEPFIRDVNDTGRLIEVCLSNQTNAALLYVENVTPRFFDLSSAEAGLILDKLRRFQIRLAVVCPAGSAHFSSRFSEILADDLAVFGTREAACGWLSR